MLCAQAPSAPSAREAAPAAVTVTVLFTDVPHTLDALRLAATLGRGLDSKIQILVPVVVPWPLALTEPPVSPVHFERRLTTIANGTSVPTRISIVHCRDRAEAIESCLEPHSIVVIGWRRRRLFDKTRRLAERLKALGHHVVTAAATKGA
jgi:hypothetical protein